jgi:hypothetical protein
VSRETPSTESAEPGAAKLRVSIASTSEELAAVSRLRYRVWVDEMGNRKTHAADHASKTMSDEIDAAARVFYLANGDDVIATIRSITAEEAPQSKYVRFYQLAAMPEVPRHQITFSSNLIIAPEWRGTRALGHLLDAMYEDGRRRGAWLDFIHCAPSLVSLYEALGYRRFMPNVLETEIGLRVPLALVADDAAYLSKVRSPFARLVPRFDSDPGHANWFATRFAEYSQPSCARLMGADEFWNFLTERIHVDDHPLFRDVPIDESKRVLNAGTIIRVAKGNVAIRSGDIGSDMFMVLAGVAEVRAGDGARRVLETLGKGQIFGEMSFLSRRPRTADVVALSDLELLSISRDFLERLARTAPATASRVLLNLADYLVDRLQNTTRSLVDAIARSESPAVRP